MRPGRSSERLLLDEKGISPESVTFGAPKVPIRPDRSVILSIGSPCAVGPIVQSHLMTEGLK